MTSSSAHDDPLGDIVSQFGSASRSVDRILQAARVHLGMDIAFISEFLDDMRVFRHVDSGVDRTPLAAGDSLPLDTGYCRNVIEGRLPQLIADTATVPAALAIADTHSIPIGAHLSVPIVLAGGRIYGTFCCFSFRADHTLNDRDLGVMHTLAGLVAEQLDQDLESIREREAMIARIRDVLDCGQPRMVYQPIFRLEDGGIEGVECLARFDVEPIRPPNEWFADAAAVGMGIALESAAIRRALDELRNLPDDIYAAINCSPEAIISGELASALRSAPHQSVVLEITEHSHVMNYAQLRQALIPLRASGARIAIDDTGAGYASMRHILTIDPDIIKLDISLTHNIHRDRRRRAFAGAMLEFARQTGSSIIAEGLENADELATLRELGVREAQGFHLARPMPLAELIELIALRRR